MQWLRPSETSLWHLAVAIHHQKPSQEEPSAPNRKGSLKQIRTGPQSGSVTLAFSQLKLLVPKPGQSLQWTLSSQSEQHLRTCQGALPSLCLPTHTWGGGWGAGGFRNSDETFCVNRLATVHSFAIIHILFHWGISMRCSSKNCWFY